MARRIQRKELRKPDEFLDLGSRVLNWIADHRTALGIGIAAVLVLVFGIMLVMHLRRSANVEEWRPLMDAVPVRAMATAEDADPLAMLGRQDPAVFVDGQKIRKVAEGGESDAVRALADLAVAGDLLAQGDGAGAEQRYVAFLATNPRLDSAGRLVAQEGLGYALERQGKTDAAVQAFARIADLSDGSYKALALYHQGRLAAEAGRDEDARKAFLEAKGLESPRPADVVGRIESWLRRLDLASSVAAPPSAAPPPPPAPIEPVPPPAVPPDAEAGTVDAGTTLATDATEPVEPLPAPSGDVVPQPDAATTP